MSRKGLSELRVRVKYKWDTSFEVWTGTLHSIRWIKNNSTVKITGHKF